MVLGFILVLFMSLNSDAMTSYAGEPVKAVLHIIALAIAGFAVYVGYATFFEQRGLSELALPGMGRQLGVGLITGAALYAACELILMPCRVFNSLWPDPPDEPAGHDRVGAVHCRRGRYLVGCGRHADTPAVVEHRLPHGMNYTQSAIFSGIVAGKDAQPGLIRSTVNGPDWLTGGNFGVESSVLALLLCTTTGIVMLVTAVKRGRVVPPIWKRPGRLLATRHSV